MPDDYMDLNWKTGFLKEFFKWTLQDLNKAKNNNHFIGIRNGIKCYISPEIMV